MPSLGLELDRRATCTVVRAAGELDLATVGDLRHALYAAVDDGPPLVVLDLAAVPFVDSTGIGVLVSAMKRARARGGDLRLAAPVPIVRHLFEVSGLVGVLTVAASAEEAVAGA